jgi:hypothetical protein
VEGHGFSRADKTRAEGATALPKARSEGAAGTTRSIAFVFISLPTPTLKNPRKTLSSPPAPPKSLNSNKTNEKKVENN